MSIKESIWQDDTNIEGRIKMRNKEDQADKRSTHTSARHRTNYFHSNFRFQYVPNAISMKIYFIILFSNNP